MANQMLILFGIFVDRVNLDVKEPAIDEADTAMATFAYFLFVIYFVFGTMLAVFRNDIIKDADTQPLANGTGTDEESMELPPENI